MNVFTTLTAKYDFLKPSTEIGNELDLYYRNMPLQIYVRNTHGLYVWGNETVSSLLSLPDRKDLFKKDIFDVCEAHCATETDLNDQEVLKKGLSISCKETAVFKNGVNMIVVSQKQPIYDFNNDIVGLVGMSMSVPISNKSETLRRLQQQGLTVREAEIALAYSKKTSAKEIALRFDISHRTVQKHIENIRIKLNLLRPSQLFEFIEHSTRSF